jgi:hypothetical protein
MLEMFKSRPKPVAKDAEGVAGAGGGASAGGAAGTSAGSTAGATAPDAAEKPGGAS